MTREIIDFLKMNDVEYKENYRLSQISPIRIGGESFLLAYPGNVEKLIKLVESLENEKISYKILGRMSNVLPKDDCYDGVVIRTDRIYNLEINGNRVIAHCGLALPRLAAVMCEAGLSGFEGISGIPGSIGGSLIGNAGAFGREMSDLVNAVSVYLIDSKRVVSLSADECGFSYRNSYLSRLNCIVLSAEFSLTRSDRFSVKQEMDRCFSLRKATQPIGVPSLGSTFKRPTNGIFAAKLIDECGLKGYSIGGAQISEKHAGFIVNTGNATAKDYLTLADYAAGCVYSKFNIKLDREFEIL